MLLLGPLLLTLIAFAAIGLIEVVRDIFPRGGETRQEAKPEVKAPVYPSSTSMDPEILRYIQELKKEKKE